MYVCINMSTNTVKHILTAYNEYINDKPNQFTYTRPSRFSPILNDENIGYGWIKLGLWPKPMHTGARKSFCTPKAYEKLRMIIDQHRPWER